MLERLFRKLLDYFSKCEFKGTYLTAILLVILLLSIDLLIIFRLVEWAYGNHSIFLSVVIACVLLLQNYCLFKTWENEN